MRITSVIAVLLLVSTASQAGTNRWTTSGPGVPNVLDLAIDSADGQAVFALTQDGIYKTTNGGDLWARADSGLPLGPISSFVIGRDDTLTVFAAINGTIWASPDGGEHWFRRGVVGALDNRLEWEARTKTLYVLTGSHLFVSSDRGLTWSLSLPQYVSNVAISSTSIHVLSFPDAKGNSSVLQSADGGQTWMATGVAAGPVLYAGQDTPALFSVFNGTVLFSSDDGKSWTKLPRPPAARVVMMRPRSSVLYVATEKGVLSYAFSTKSWTRIGSSVVGNALAVDDTTSWNVRVFVADSSGLSRFTLGAYGDWEHIHNGLPTASTSDIAISSAAPAIGYSSGAVGLSLTEDAGRSWKKLASASALGIAVSPNDPDTAYTVGWGVVKTSDRGKTWTTISPNTPLRLATTSDPATLYAAFADGMSRSSDGGYTWNSIDSGLAPFYSYYGFYYYSTFRPTAMAVNPANPANVAIAYSQGVFTTANGGTNWKNAYFFGDVSAMTIDESWNVYAAKGSGGVMVGGGSAGLWSSAQLRDKNIQALTAQGDAVFAGTSDGHVYRSTDRGATWSGLDDGLGRAVINKIAVDDSGQHLYVATGAGVFEMEPAAQDLGVERLDGQSPPSFGDPMGQTEFVLPIVGSVSGVAASYSTEATLTNMRDIPQRVNVMWLPLNGSAPPSLFRTTLPPGDTKLFDINATFGVDGVGSMAVVAVDENDHADPDASIGGVARILGHPSDGRAPFAQRIGEASGALLDRHAQETVKGLTQDETRRVSVGVVNLSGESRQVTIQISGKDSSSQMTVVAPAFSLVQLPLPEGNFGMMSIDGMPDDPTARWILIGTEIDRQSGEAQTLIGFDRQVQ